MIDYDALMGDDEAEVKAASDLIGPGEKWDDPLLGYALSNSRSMLCRPCAQEQMTKFNGYHPKLQGLGHTIPLMRPRGSPVQQGSCLFCGKQLVGTRAY